MDYCITVDKRKCRKGIKGSRTNTKTVIFTSSNVKYYIIVREEESIESETRDGSFKWRLEEGRKLNPLNSNILNEGSCRV